MRRIFWTSVMCAIAAVGVWAVSAGGADRVAAPSGAVGPSTQPAGGGVATDPLARVQTQLAGLKPALDDLEKAVTAGDKNLALAKLKAVRNLVAKANAAANGFANVKCPIMGGPIDPDHMTISLERQWKGQKIGFCCGGCPEAWDKLTDAEKQAKLDAAK